MAGAAGRGGVEHETGLGACEKTSLSQLAVDPPPGGGKRRRAVPGVHPGLESVPLAYAVYLLSAYGLTAAAGLAVRAGRRVWQWVRSIPLAERWLEDEYFRVWAGLLLSFLVNLCYAGLKVVCAVLYSSFWEGALGFYYILLSAVRLYLLRHTPSSRGGSDYTRELRAWPLGGGLPAGAEPGPAVDLGADRPGRARATTTPAPSSTRRRPTPSTA